MQQILKLLYRWILQALMIQILSRHTILDIASLLLAKAKQEGEKE
jgi:hypothetical protein